MRDSMRVILISALAAFACSCTSIANQLGVHNHGMKKRLFKPSGRIYFDTGTDDVGEVDIFKDGSLTASITLLELYGPLANKEYEPPARDQTSSDLKADWAWRFGPTVGFGITSPADDSADGMSSASGAPVVLFTAGFLLELPIVEKSRSIVGIEFGVAMGFSPDEGLDDADDSAVYVGLTIDIPWN